MRHYVCTYIQLCMYVCVRMCMYVEMCMAMCGVHFCVMNIADMSEMKAGARIRHIRLNKTGTCGVRVCVCV